MLEAMQSLRDKFQTMKKSAKQVEVDQTSASASKPGRIKQTDTLPLNTAPNTQPQLNTQPSEHMDEPMEMDVYGSSLPPRFGQSAQSEHGSDPNHGSDHQSKQPKQVCTARAKSIRTKGSIRLGQNTYLVFIFRGGSFLCSCQKVC